jgi:ubiquinone/menaquinone biosynthesis C-methylase UbiE
MTRLARAEHADELMDRPDVDPAVLADALDHVAAVNRWLGGRRALLRHLPWALEQQTRPGPARVLDVGTGSGDLPLAVSAWSRRHGRPVQITAVDLHGRTLRVATERTRHDPVVRLARADGLQLPFDTGAFDAGLMSMTLHHMDGPALTGILRELRRVTRGGAVLVGELERSLPGYLSARLLAATVWRRNPVTRHDGPLSVRRAFTADELVDLAREAGFSAPSAHRHPFFRVVLRAHA